MSSTTRCSLCQQLSTEECMKWCQQQDGAWWYPCCGTCYNVMESTVSFKVRQHWGGDKLMKEVSERVAFMAESMYLKTASEPERVQRRRLQ